MRKLLFWCLLGCAAVPALWGQSTCQLLYRNKKGAVFTIQTKGYAPGTHTEVTIDTLLKLNFNMPSYYSLYAISGDDSFPLVRDEEISTFSAQQALISMCGLPFLDNIVYYGDNDARKRPGVNAQSLSVVLPSAGIANEDLALADFNGDGVIDAAAATSTGITVTLFNANGTVLSTAFYPVNGVGASLLATDLNGDGFVDLAVTQNDASGQGNVVVLLGKGDGTFGSATKFPTGSDYAFYLAAGDFNGDGIPDLAVSDDCVCGAATGSVSVLLGQPGGKGSFGAPVTLTASPNVGTVVVADFNNDGNLDIAALDAYFGLPNKVWVYLGNGKGGFQAPKSTATGTGTGYLAYVDLNHDGNLDLVIADQTASAVAIMFGNGDGTFGAPTEYLASAQPTIVAPLPLEDGSTLFLAPDSDTLGIVGGFAAQDGTMSFPQLQFLGKGPASVAAANLNSDDQPDLVITDSEAGNVYVMLATGGGQFGTPATISLGTQPGALALADLTGAGNQSAVIADANGLDVLLGNGNGTFQPVKTYPAGGALSSVTVADFSLNGKLDVAAANAATGGVSLFVNNGNGTLGSAQPVPVGSAAPALAVASGDINRDGKPDLVVAFSPADRVQAGGVAVLLGEGGGTFQPPVVTTLSGALVQQGAGSALSAPLAVGDINGDGRPDVVTIINGATSNQVAVLLGNGNGTFQAPILMGTNTAPTMLAISDINGDGFPDLVLTDCCGLSEASYLLGNGDGTFQAEVQFPSGPDPTWIAVSDFNADGAPDMAVVGQGRGSQGTYSIMFNGFPRLSVSPVTPSLLPSQTQQFTVTGYFGTSTAVTWSLENEDGTASTAGTISAAGLYTAPASITSQQTVVVAATSVSNANYTASAEITLSPPPQYQLTITASPAGGGTVTPANGSTYAAGTVVSITATAASGYQFIGWTGPVASASSASTTVTMSAAETVTANFTAAGHPAFFAGEGFLSGTAYYLQFPDGNLFGYYEYLSSSILYHFDMGYEAFIPGAGNQIYFYDFASGHWWYSSASLFPYLYDFTLNTFIYYFPDTKNTGHYTTNPRYFSNLTTQKIFTM